MVFDADFSRRCGESGFIGMTWPKAFGGGERSPLERYVVLEEFLAAGAPVGAHWIADRQSGPQILRHGSDALREDILPRICRGEVSFAIGMSEPDAGSDLANISSRAERVDGGWRLNGRKIWTTNGHLAEYFIGLFRTAPRNPEARHEGMTQFVVPLDSQGIERRPIDDLPGHADFSEVVLDDVFLSDDHVLGTPGQGWEMVTSELANERSGPERFLSVFPLLAAALEAAGQGGLDGARAGVGRIVTHLAVLRQMSMSVAGRLANGGAPALEAAVAKDLGNELEREIPEFLRALPGFLPATGGRAVDALLLDTVLAAPSFTLRGGTPEILRNIIARGLGLR
jgi:alkylation response protein AidB-like acyl-CoA dehydrogenase